MSFLALAFALGALGIAFPIIFHLIRPTPKGRQPFSSLMFLKTSPPRISRRSRLDHWLLLILRSVIILALAAAFMRPFFRQNVELFSSNLATRRVAILLDTSASMRRGDLWEQARAKIEAAMDDLDPGDDLALITFDDSVQTIVGFSDDDELPSAKKIELVRGRIRELYPSWGSTNLGRALIDAVDSLREASDRQQSIGRAQIVLVTDLQQGTDLSALEAYGWPEDVPVDLQTVARVDSSNAFARVLTDDSPDESSKESRVRVANAGDSNGEQFFVRWQNERKTTPIKATAFYVPPGQSRTLRVPREPSAVAANHLVLTGDSDAFDNIHYVVPIQPQTAQVIYLGDDNVNDAGGLLYFLKRALVNSDRQTIQIEQVKTGNELKWEPGSPPALIVVAAECNNQQRQAVDDFLSKSGTVLVVLRNERVASSLADRLGIRESTIDPSQSGGDGTQDQYLMLAEIDFSHAIFAPLAGPRYNDFTKIKFWRHQPIEIEPAADCRVIARFDNDRPALWQRNVAGGTVFGLAADWSPESSQLALSSKFVPIVNNLLTMALPDRPTGEMYYVHDTIELADDQNQSAFKVERPDGSEISGGQSFAPDVLNQPGIYHLTIDDISYDVAVNLRPAESRTAMMPPETLETYDVQLGNHPNQDQQRQQLQKIKDTELESSQKIWKWLLVGAMVLLIVETVIAGRHKVKSTETGVNVND